MKNLITLIIFTSILYFGISIESAFINLIIRDLGSSATDSIYYGLWIIVAVFTWLPLLYVTSMISTLIYIILDKNNY
jgi:hypothetical protein